MKLFVRILIIYTIIINTTQAQSHSESINRILERGELIVAINPEDTSPFIIKNEKDGLSGFDIEIVELLAKRLDVNVRYIERNFMNEVIALVAQGEADLAISQLAPSMNRAKLVRFSEPYYYLETTFVVRRGQTPRRAMRNTLVEALDQPHMRIGVLAGTSHVHSAIESFSQAQIIEFENMQAIHAALESKEIDSAMLNKFQTNIWSKQNPEVAIFYSIITAKLFEEPLVIMVNFNDNDFLALLNYYLSAIEREGFLKELENKYLKGQ